MSEQASQITAPAQSLGPWRRVWQRFRRHRRGYLSLWLFSILFVLSLGAELLANNRPLLVLYQHQLYLPLIHDYPETTFGGDFATNADYTDPYVIAKIREHGWLLRAPIPFSYDTIDYYNPAPNPAPPNARHWLGTDDRGRDVAARLIYGFRLSVLFGFALTAIGMVIGMLAGAVQGYLGGKVDLFFQRFIEVWGSLPELYLLIIFASIFQPSIGLLLILLSLFGWIGLSDYVRAEFLKGRNLEYVRAARALGVSGPRIMFRHLLPNALTPVITFLPFRVSGAILALTSLDFLGLGVPPSTPSLGELLAQGKNNIDAWWLSLTTFAVLVGTLLLLIFIGEALRAAFDTRQKSPG
ncbi:ABC transporter permease [Halothiobacillus sp.]|uniref:ABC transporter permease n=1 Tax=Halothiobacillus sp. TaxID=1891311 RepID=UPI002622D0CB|nr:ABC transporter permease [Halothiobacillus sp.]